MKKLAPANKFRQWLLLFGFGAALAVGSYAQLSPKPGDKPGPTPQKDSTASEFRTLTRIPGLVFMGWEYYQQQVREKR